MHYFSSWLLVRLAIILSVSIVAQMFSQPSSAAQTEHPDYEIPYGHFYTQAHPTGANGEGYSVTSSLGVPFWDAYLAHGGWQRLGYPISRRYIADGRITQAFERGRLHWNETESTVGFSEWPGRPNPPELARTPENAHRAEGRSARQPWSGWWWSVSGAGPSLDAIGGPLWKYDRAVSSLGQPNPGTRIWEATVLAPAGLGFQWAGHCNGWAAAAILEEEPVDVREFGGVTFSIGDQKGLLSDLHFADSAQWAYGGDSEVNPADFHRMLITWIGGQRQAMIMTFRIGNDEIWSFPAYRFQLVYGPDPSDPEWSTVRATVWFADNDVAPDFVGTRHWPSDEGKVFHYQIQGAAENPVDGNWIGPSRAGRFSHPLQIWYPEPAHRNIERQLIAPGLEEQTIREITGMVLPSPTPILTPTAAASPSPTATRPPTMTVTLTPSPSPTPSQSEVTPSRSASAVPRIIHRRAA